jgi:uncharacterized protein DUF4149
MRAVRALHDLALALVAGGIAGVALCVSLLFARAPSREVAGQIGSAIFGHLGSPMLLLATIVFGARLVMRSRRAAGAGGSVALAASALLLCLAALSALWLTPEMTAIWTAGAHAADGTGLIGEDRRRFLMLHGTSNLAYLGMLALSVLLIAWPEPKR